jgi:hypothetical protein
MKVFFVSLMAFSAATTLAANVTANSFDCIGENNTSVSFTTTSFIGSPTFHATIQGEEVQASSTASIKLQPSPMGTLVTVDNNRLAVVDGPVVHITLVVPHVTLSTNQPSEKFETYAIRTTVANPFMRPQTNPLVSETNEIIPVECQAAAVLF